MGLKFDICGIITKFTDQLQNLETYFFRNEKIYVDTTTYLYYAVWVDSVMCTQLH